MKKEDYTFKVLIICWDGVEYERMSDTAEYVENSKLGYLRIGENGLPIYDFLKVLF